MLCVIRLVAWWVGECAVRTTAKRRLLGWYVWQVKLAWWRRHSSTTVRSRAHFSHSSAGCWAHDSRLLSGYFL